ncbi:MAG TPA: M56 family metallopeptidase, partial [Chloroflexota bacterium]|nr:M56 family metallopeptidase [Chloroflexota bacterium]
MHLFNTASAQWGTLMLHASVAGGTTIVLLWALSRLWPQMSPSGRSWLWRAAFCKLLLALFWRASVGVPVLPTNGTLVTSTPHQGPVFMRRFSRSALEPSRDATFSRPATAFAPWPPATTQGNQDRPISAPEIRQDSLIISDVANDAASISTVLAPPTLIPTRVTLSSVALCCWLLGVAFLAARALMAWQVTRRLRAESEPLDDPTLVEAVDKLRRSFGLARSPELSRCSAVDALALTGVLKPVVLLPPDLAVSRVADLELMLAHELAHQKRHDLAWSWLLWAGETLFWFHPLVWLGAREWRMAQEVACDSMAVRATRAPVAAYGAMLMK